MFAYRRERPCPSRAPSERALTRLPVTAAPPPQAEAVEQLAIERPQIKPLRPVELNLGSACGKFALGESGWQQSAPGGAGGADADANTKLLAEIAMLKRKIEGAGGADADGETQKLLAENAMLKRTIEGAGGAEADGENQKLLAENNMLKLKIDILVEMLARANLDIDAATSRQ